MNHYRAQWYQHSQLMHDNSSPEMRLQEVQDNTIGKQIAITAAVHFIPGLGTAMAVYSIYDYFS